MVAGEAEAEVEASGSLRSLQTEFLDSQGYTEKLSQKVKQQQNQNRE